MEQDKDKLSKELMNGKQPELPKQIPPQVQKELAKLKDKLEKFSKELKKKYSYVLSIGLLPAQLPPKGPLPPEMAKKMASEKPKPELLIVFPDDKMKEVKKLEKDISEMIKKKDLDVKFRTRSPKELWQTSFDGHYMDMERMSMAYPFFDEGILSALRVATVHKNLVLRKFEKYVTSYVIAGSLVRGQATKTSDLDVYVIIDDTDVKRMSRFELKERLRAMIHSFAFEANEIASAKNKLSPQIYLLTDFWESVKDANPVIFTFIRDGVPLYDRGAFMPWKLLLKMGKIKPSPEAIDNFMSLGEKLEKKVKADLNRIVTEDIYWGIITPSQAALMLYGSPPPTPLETIKEMERIFVNKEKLLEKKYIRILEKVVGLYKDHEHGRLKDITGKNIDSLLEDTSDYIKRLKELVKQIEKQSGEKTILQIYEDTFTVLKSILGKMSDKKLVEEFKKELVDRAKIPPQSINLLNEIVKAKANYKKGSLSKHTVNDVRKGAQELLQFLTEYEQRKNLILTEKAKFTVKVDGEMAELFIFESGAYFVSKDKKVLKIDFKEKKQKLSDLKELADKIKNMPKRIEIKQSRISEIKKILGKDFTFIF